MDESRKQFIENFSQNFQDGKTVNLWDIWQVAWTASRAAIEIKAPRFIGSREALAKGYTVDYSNGFGDGMDAYEDAIRAAGIKVKE